MGIGKDMIFYKFSSLLKGQLQQGMGRDYPFALPMDEYTKSWDRKNLFDVYGAKTDNLFSHYVPCYEEIAKVGGTSYSYNQMYSLSKPEIQMIFVMIRVAHVLSLYGKMHTRGCSRLESLEFFNFCERANVFLDGIHEICSKLLKSLIYSI